MVFLLLGAMIFVLFQQVSDDTRPAADEIMIKDQQVQLLVLRFKKVWQRPPLEKEIDGLIENYIREEVLYREAKAMGLDQDDPIIKRRLRQKLEFLSEDLIKLDTPDDQVLQAFLTAHPENYLQPSITTFQHLYFNPQQRGRKIAEDAQEALKILQADDSDRINLGDPLNIKQEFINGTEAEISRILGVQFTKLLRDLPVGDWQGPIKSGFGLHLVQIDERIVAEMPNLADVRKQLLQDWKAQKRDEANEAFYNSLRKRYKVTVENRPADLNTEPLVSGKDP